jgi:hypothetical protein
MVFRTGSIASPNVTMVLPLAGLYPAMALFLLELFLGMILQQLNLLLVLVDLLMLSMVLLVMLVPAQSPCLPSAPVCSSVPVRTCNKIPVNTPKKVIKTACKTVVDVKIIKDCADTVSTTWTQHSHSSAVVGSYTKVPVIGGYTGGAAVSAPSPDITGYVEAGTGYEISGYAGGDLLGAAADDDDLVEIDSASLVRSSK